MRSCASPAHRALDHRVERHLTRVERLGLFCVLVHQLGEQVLVERAPVHPDPYRLGVGQRHLEDRLEVLVAPLGPHVARVDAVLGERRRHLGVLGQQEVPVVMEVANDGDGHVPVRESRDDLGYRLCRRLVVHGHAHQLAAGLGQGCDLLHGRVHIGGVGVGHRLDHDGMARPHGDIADPGGDRCAAGDGRHGAKYRRTALRGPSPGRRLYRCESVCVTPSDDTGTPWPPPDSSPARTRSAPA
jgi:hypothetical protein